MDTWTKIGTVAAIAAALAAVAAVVVAWYYGQRALSESDRALRYERLREARDLVAEIRVTADNMLFGRTDEACAQLRAVLVTLGNGFDAVHRLATTAWNLDAYSTANGGLQASVAAARAELENAVAKLSQ